MKLYIYDHCPYCVKARIIFGIKKIDFELITLLNDDEVTPISMVGQKLLPILEKEDGSYMPESMDIVAYIDNNYGKPALERGLHPELEEWLGRMRIYTYKLTMPRWARVPDRQFSEFLQEFTTESARDYFTKKKEAYIGSFTEHLDNSSQYILEVNDLLKDLEQIIKIEHLVAEKPEEIDIHLFTTLRSLSIVKGLKYPKKVNNYRLYMSDYSGVPLHDEIAV